MDGPGGRVVVLDSLTHCDERVGPCDVVVAGSFAGPLAFGFALERGVRALVAHAAGGGLDGAGIAGLALADGLGVPAAAVETMSARIGDGRSVHDEGVVGHVNTGAAALGVHAGMAAAAAARRLLGAPAGRVRPGLALVDRSHRVAVETAGGRVVLMGSTSFAVATNHHDVLCVGSHAGLVNAGPLRAVRPRGVVFNDGGRARRDSGISALPALDALGVAAAAVAAMSARIGDAVSTWETGIVSALNETARRCGVAIGQPARDAAVLMLHNTAGHSPRTPAQAGAQRPRRSEPMPFASVGGVKIHYEEVGHGVPLVFVHEFAGDAQSWRPQVSFFARRYRTIAFNARGYPPSDVPEDPAAYSQEQAVEDIRGVLDHLGIAKAHVCGLSMGGYATLHFGLTYPERALSLVVAGAGYGSADREKFKQDSAVVVKRFDEGMPAVAAFYAKGPTRVQLMDKDPLGWQEFRDHLAAGSARGHALTMQGVQMQRPSIFDLGERMERLEVPALIVTGDEDEACLEPGIFMKRKIPASGLLVIPKSGHTINLEEPEAFNRAVLDFLTAVDAGRWTRRNPASLSASAILPPDQAGR